MSYHESYSRLLGTIGPITSPSWIDGAWTFPCRCTKMIAAVSLRRSAARSSPPTSGPPARGRAGELLGVPASGGRGDPLLRCAAGSGQITCAAWRVLCSTWWWTCGWGRLGSASRGPCASTTWTDARYFSLRVSATASWHSRSRRRCCTCARLRMLPGANLTRTHSTPRSASPGRWTAWTTPHPV